MNFLKYYIIYNKNVLCVRNSFGHKSGDTKQHENKVNQILNTSI